MHPIGGFIIPYYRAVVLFFSLSNTRITLPANHENSLQPGVGLQSCGGKRDEEMVKASHDL